MVKYIREFVKGFIRGYRNARIGGKMSSSKNPIQVYRDSITFAKAMESINIRL